MKNLKKKLRILILRIRIFLDTTKEILGEFWEPLPEDLKTWLLAMGLISIGIAIANLLGLM